MPKLNDDTQKENYEIPGSSFVFSGVRPGELEETEYTLATIVVDKTGSVRKFDDDLLQALKDSVKACKKSPRAENLLLRVVQFNNSVDEIHGFKPLNEIDPDNDYSISPDGRTALFDATFDSVGSTLKYGEVLVDQDFSVNGIVFVITDGGDNMSSATPTMINERIEDALQSEKLESLVTVLVGVNVNQYKRELDQFQAEANLTEFVDIGDASPGKLAKLARFVSRSISSTSQALGSGKSVSDDDLQF